MRLGLLAVILGLSGPASQNLDSKAAAWAAADVGPAYAATFVSNELCASSAAYLYSCLAAVDRAGALFSPPFHVRIDADGWRVDRSAPLMPPEDADPRQRYEQRRLTEARLRREAERAYAGRTGAPLDFEAELRRMAALLPPSVPAPMFWGRVIAGHLRAFDAHADVKPAGFLTRQQNNSQQNIVGIGFDLYFMKRGPLVHEVFAGSPAAAAGLRSGDRLLAVAHDGSRFQSVTALSFERISALLSGAEGSAVGLRLERDGRRFDAVVKRAPVSIPAVSSRLEGTVGELRIRNFASLDTCSLAKEQLFALQSRGADSFLLDLRGDPGGEKIMAVCVAGLFVGLRRVVGTREIDLGVPSLRGRFARGWNNGPGIFWERGTSLQLTSAPLVVLVDAASASAAEMVAGALQDSQRAWIVGERTAGKGSVQEWRAPLDNPSILIRRTVARFFQPGGRSNQVVGIEPDFVVPWRADLSTEDRFFPREAELHPDTLPAISSEWVNPRPDEAARLARCAGAEAALEAAAPTDQQESFARAVLSCLR
jgi:carboxyl-terminal processing protease